MKEFRSYEDLLLYVDPGFNEEGNIEKRRNFYHKNGFKRCTNSKYWVNNLI